MCVNYNTFDALHAHVIERHLLDHAHAVALGVGQIAKYAIVLADKQLFEIALVGGGGEIKIK